MAMATEPRTEVTPHRVDGIGGVRCKGCDEPFFKLDMTEQKPVGVIKLRHKACGTYNVVDLGQLIYS